MTINDKLIGFLLSRLKYQYGGNWMLINLDAPTFREMRFTDGTATVMMIDPATKDSNNIIFKEES